MFVIFSPQNMESNFLHLSKNIICFSFCLMYLYLILLFLTKIKFVETIGLLLQKEIDFKNNMTSRLRNVLIYKFIHILVL